MGPWKLGRRGKQWKGGQEWQEALEDYDFQAASRWFGEYLQAHARHVGEGTKGLYRAPDSGCYRIWAKCIKIPLAPRRWQRLEEALKRTAGLIKRPSKDLAEVPAFV